METFNWRIAGDTLALVPQKAAVRTASTWHDVGVQPGTGEVFTRRVRLEGRRLVVMPLTPHTAAEVFEQDDRPTAAPASGSVGPVQAITPADLVGRWAEVGDTTGAFTDYRADSTFVQTNPIRKYEPGFPATMGVPLAFKLTGSWRLAGDTLTTTVLGSGVEFTLGWQETPLPPGVSAKPESDLVRLEGKRLAVTFLWPERGTKVFERVNAPATSGAPATAGSVPSKP